jgi:hypothetical protein
MSLRDEILAKVRCKSNNLSKNDCLKMFVDLKNAGIRLSASENREILWRMFPLLYNHPRELLNNKVYRYKYENHSSINFIGARDENNAIMAIEWMNFDWYNPTELVKIKILGCTGKCTVSESDKRVIEHLENTGKLPSECGDFWRQWISYTDGLINYGALQNKKKTGFWGNLF